MGKGSGIPWSSTLISTPGFMKGRSQCAPLLLLHDGWRGKGLHLLVVVPDAGAQALGQMPSAHPLVDSLHARSVAGNPLGLLVQVLQGSQESFLRQPDGRTSTLLLQGSTARTLDEVSAPEAYCAQKPYLRLNSLSEDLSVWRMAEMPNCVFSDNDTSCSA